MEKLARTHVKLIGGYNDGRLWKIESGYKGNILNMPCLPPTPDSKSWIGWEHYRLRVIKGEGLSFVVWVHESLSLDEALSRLIDSYGKPKEASD